jgi:Major Facilitator Superfamily
MRNSNRLHFFKFISNSLNKWHLHSIIQSFAQSLISVFIPIFMLKMGISLKEIFLYYIIYTFFYAFTGIFSFLIPKLGFKVILISRPFFLIIYFIWIYLLEFFPNSLYLLAIYNGLCSFYWISFDYLFSLNANIKNIEFYTGNLFAFPKLVNLMAPFLGGLIITAFSFDVLFIIVGIFLFLSIIPLFYLGKNFPKTSFNFKKLFNKKFLSFLPGFFSEGIINALIFVLIPIQIFLIFNKPLDLGLFSTFIGLSGFVAPLLVSYLLKNKFNKYIKIGALIESILFIPIFFLNTRFHYFLFGFIIGLVPTIWKLPFFSKVYSFVKKNKSLEFLVVKGFVINLSYGLPFLLMFLFNNIKLIYIIEIFSKIFLFLS